MKIDKEFKTGGDLFWNGNHSKTVKILSMEIPYVNEDSTLGAALLASKFCDQSLNLRKHFDQKSGGNS